jgi:2-amino-4-hydroxy-6-hydroxymethyldihydropteridine diphosphokinase
MTEVFIGIGSNLGDREENIQRAVASLKKNPHIKVDKVSSLIETEPAEGLPQPRYLNGVIKIRTDLLAADLLKFLQDIERALGRERTVKNGPRTIDLDILLYGDEVIDGPILTVPHPRMWEREFVLRPLEEIHSGIVERMKQIKGKSIFHGIGKYKRK